MSKDMTLQELEWEYTQLLGFMVRWEHELFSAKINMEIARDERKYLEQKIAKMRNEDE